MRIVVNDIAASHGGAMTVLKDFYSTVCSYDKENEWIFLLNDRYFEEVENVKIITLPEIKKSKAKKLLFDFVTGRKFIQKLQPDIVFSLQNIITFGVKVPQVVYIHQSIPFQSVKKFSFFKGSERKLAIVQHVIGAIIKKSAKKSDRIIVQTAWMKDAVCQFCRLPQSKVCVSVPSVYLEQPVLDDCAFDQTMFFYPTSKEIYKNNACIQQAVCALEEKGVSHSVTLTLPQEAGKGSISCVGRLPREDVLKWYRRSTLIFPSYIETFGYPLAEARAVGTVILASDTPFSREVLYGYENAYFFNPFDPQELASLMEMVVDGRISKKQIEKKQFADDDSWQKVIKYILEMKHK